MERNKPYAGRKVIEPAKLLHFPILALLLLMVPLAMAKGPVPKPSSDECLACHGDSTLNKEVNGKRVSLYVNPETFKTSIHGGMFSCVDCHTDLKSSPHDGTPAKVSCATCHADQQAVYDR